jgi:phage terminase large subunit
MSIREREYRSSIVESFQLLKLTVIQIEKMFFTQSGIANSKAFEANDLIAISSECDHLDRLIDELSTPRKDYDNSGRSKVESKKDLDKRDIPSPNLDDVFVMAFAPRTGSFTLSNI